MIALRVASLIHNARNRLLPLATALREKGDTASADDVEHAGALLGLAMTLFKQGRNAIEVCPVDEDLPSFFAEFEQDIRRFCPKTLETTLKTDLSGLPFPVWSFDRQLLQLALLDALMNAWRHARHSVQVTVFSEGSLLCFEILDDGPGFPESLLAGQTDAAPIFGTGMGLEIARQIAAGHVCRGEAGRVELSNAGGARFRLLLP